MPGGGGEGSRKSHRRVAVIYCILTYTYRLTAPCLPSHQVSTNTVLLEVLSLCPSPYSGKSEKWKVTETHVGWEREDNNYVCLD